MCVLINPLILFSDVPRRCIRRTTTDCRLYQLSHAECHLVAVEVVGLLAGGFRRLRFTNLEPVLKARRNPGNESSLLFEAV